MCLASPLPKYRARAFLPPLYKKGLKPKGLSYRNLPKLRPFHNFGLESGELIEVPHGEIGLLI